VDEPNFDRLDDATLLKLYARAKVTMFVNRLATRRPVPQGVYEFCKSLSREISARQLDQRPPP